MFSKVPTSVSCRPVGEHFARDRFDALDAHQHHLSPAEFGEGREVDRGFGFFRIFVAGEESDVRIHSAVCDRNAGVSRSGERRGDSRNHLEGKVGGSERLRLFPAATKHKRIPALQPDNLFSRSRLLHQQPVDFFLRQRVRPCPLSGVDELGALPRPLQHFGI
jgi:hypothetical protein